MNYSFSKIRVTSVLALWVLSFIVILIYTRSLSWIEDGARGDGVYLMYELLNDLPQNARASRLSELQPNFSVEFNLVSVSELSDLLDRTVTPGETILSRVSTREEWIYQVFEDGNTVLTAGPVNPVPQGVLPIGLVVSILGLPLVAGLVALRVEKGLSRVEQASQALAVGDLSARVTSLNPPEELAASFNAMAERVEQLVRSRDELVQAVSHELGSPLSRLRFQVELLGNDWDSSPADRIEAMTRELDSLDELVSELLSYVQSDESELERLRFRPESSLSDLIELARLETPEDSPIDITREIQPDLTVFADRRLLLRAIENLLRNAVRYAKSKVLVEARADQQFVQIIIHDDGPGIPSAKREQVIQPFIRLSSDRDRKSGGVGLGLAIVSRIMERHGGRFTIGSSPLGGAKTITLWPVE